MVITVAVDVLVLLPVVAVNVEACLAISVGAVAAVEASLVVTSAVVLLLAALRSPFALPNLVALRNPFAAHSRNKIAVDQ